MSFPYFDELLKFRAFIDLKYGHHYEPEEILGYIYAVLHSPAYRQKYAEFLKIDFPRIPFVDDRPTFEKLAALGWRLVQAHLLRDIPAQPRVEITRGPGAVDQPAYNAPEQRLYINPQQYFAPVPPDVWNFHIGGYQVLDKYLKSRKGRELSLDEIIEMSMEELALFVAKAGKNRAPDPTALAEKIKQAAIDSSQIRPRLADSCKFVLASTTRTLSALKKNLKELDRAIAEEGKGFLNPLLSVKGLGLVYSSGILACIGDVKRFSSDDKLAKMAGLVWKRTQSGETESEETRLVKECDKYLRYYLVEAANSLRVHNEEYRLYYQKKYLEVAKHKHKRALVLSARKLVRLVFALLAKNQLYDPQRRFQSPVASCEKV